eukprot:COSAG01_NODE_2533_length_7491_cov_236.560741_13_plen_58_part_00
MVAVVMIRSYVVGADDGADDQITIVSWEDDADEEERSKMCVALVYVVRSTADDDDDT